MGIVNEKSKGFQRQAKTKPKEAEAPKKASSKFKPEFLLIPAAILGVGLVVLVLIRGKVKAGASGAASSASKAVNVVTQPVAKAAAVVNSSAVQPVKAAAQKAEAAAKFYFGM